jgi:ribosome recycling factor
MINELIDKSKKKMEDTISSFKRDLDSISTGRANPNILDTVKAEVYGSFMSISSLASISVADSSTVVIQVWDRDSVKAIEKAITNSNLGLNPLTEGQVIRIMIPKLSEERRKELCKLAKKYAEDKKIIIRNIRRDIIDDFKRQEKSIGASKDQVHSFTDIIQKITDEYVKKIDNMAQIKETDLMKI